MSEHKKNKKKQDEEPVDGALASRGNKEGITLGTTTDRTITAEDAPTPENMMLMAEPTGIPPRGLETGGTGGINVPADAPGTAPVLCTDEDDCAKEEEPEEE